MNQAHLQNYIIEQIARHLKKELKLNGLEAPDELQRNAMSQHATNTNVARTKPTCHHCKQPGQNRNLCRFLKKQRKEAERTLNFPGSRNSGANNSNLNNSINNRNYKNNHKNRNTARSKEKTVYPIPETSGKTHHSTENAIFERMQPMDRHPGTKDRKDIFRSKKSQSEWLEWNCSSWSRKFKVKTQLLHSGGAIDRAETTNTTLPPIPAVVWQQPQETYLINIHKNPLNYSNPKYSHLPEFKKPTM